MKVAIVAEWYPSPADPVHGIWAHRQAVATAAAGADVRVLVLRRPVPPLSVARRLRRGDIQSLRDWSVSAQSEREPWQLDGLTVIPVRWFGPPRPISYGSWGYWMGPALGRALSSLRQWWQFDLVHAHTLAPAGQAAAFWTRRHGVPLVLSAHGPDMLDVPFRSATGRRAVASALGRADLVMANSTWARWRCLELAENGQLELETMHLGADIPSDQGLTVHGSSEPLRLVTVAHLQARKHHATVLRAIAELDPERRPEYLVIGDGEEREPLQRLASELGIGDSVVFTGQLPHEDALARLSECDLFVMPGVEEPFGVAFIEAMAAGLVAIGGRGEGGPDDISAAGAGMVMVQPGSVSELAAVIDRFDRDREELAQLGQAARHTVETNFTWDRCGEQTVAAYTRTLAAHQLAVSEHSVAPGVIPER